MSDLKELYQQLIIDHSRHPRHFGKLEQRTHVKEGFNPLCGDRLMLYFLVDKEGIIEDIKFEGVGCAISIASASMMAEKLKGHSVTYAEEMFQAFHQQVIGEPLSTQKINLGKLAVLAGVSQFPMRVKCATLAWHTLRAALNFK